jgi:aryl-alcohol dehydrogenase-like predicted oxidoreductase
MAEAVGYVLSLPGVTNVIIGCSSPAEVDANAEIARRFVALNAEQQQALEKRTAAAAAAYSYFKKPS